MRWINFSLAVLFLLAALVQLNDPDPVYWIAVYSGATAVAFFAGFRRTSAFWSAVVFGGALSGMLIAAPGTYDYLLSGDLPSITSQMSTEKPWIEPARELFGLLIAAIAMAFYYSAAQRHR